MPMAIYDDNEQELAHVSSLLREESLSRGESFPLVDKAEHELFQQDGQGIVLKNRNGVFRILFAGLEYVEVINKTVFFHLIDNVVREVTAALADFEEKFLSRPEFLKPHRSYLINLNYVESIDGNSIMTRNGHNIPVSRQRRNQVQEAYVRFLHQEGAAVFATEKQAAVISEKPERPKGCWRILLVDDDETERNYWADVLRSHGCVVHMAGSGGEAFAFAAAEVYDCILLDVMIPGEDGFSICKRLRGRMANTPIIFLSCVTESEKQLEGFAVGGIDYITKDTSAELFWAKVETRIRLNVSERTQFHYGPLVLDLAGRKALIDGKQLPLSSVEFDILCRLSERVEHIFTPEEIFNMVWGEQPWDGGQMVQTHMSHLRRKLEKAWEEHQFIETVWGKGYRFVSVDN